MKPIPLFYATNRNHLPEGSRWNPSSYGTEFSADGRENLRFGKVTVSVNQTEVDKCLKAKVDGMGSGDGETLESYFWKSAETAKIEPFKENLDSGVPDDKQDPTKFGSLAFFSDLKEEMMRNTDVLIYIHGYNVSWNEAVGSAAALQEMLNRKGQGDSNQKVMVVLFTWPSDGSLFPFRAYKADRADARDSGYAVGRAFLKLRDFLEDLRQEAREGKTKLCRQDIHLLCHSMGNYVLQNALDRLSKFNLGVTLPRMFEHIFLCSADVDDTVLEEGKPLGRLHELSQSITVYYNRDDKALLVSDVTKSNPQRLGTNGAARPFIVHSKIHQIDCTSVVPGLIEHSYYLAGSVNTDIRLSIDGEAQDSSKRKRETTGDLPNVWRMKRVGK